VELDAGLADAVHVLQRSLGVAVLPGVDAGLLAAFEQVDDTLGSVPVDHVLAEQPVEVRMPIDRITANDQPRHAMRPELDGRQRGRPARLCGGGDSGRCPDSTPPMVQEITPGGNISPRCLLAPRTLSPPPPPSP